jgi:hypothetical protein
MDRWNKKLSSDSITIAIELIWGQLKKRIRRNNIFPIFDKKVVELIRSEVSKITREDWKNKIEKVIQYENYYLSLQESVTRNGSEQFVITISTQSPGSPGTRK